MNIVSAVANLVKELDYYKEQLKECKAVIKQLSEGPDEIEYIHPHDLSEIIRSSGYLEVIHLSKSKWSYGDIVTIPESGKKYKQSIYMPVKTKNIV